LLFNQCFSTSTVSRIFFHNVKELFLILTVASLSDRDN
jgi:hypothetical protein